MHSRLFPPRRRSETFDVAATMSMYQVLDYTRRTRTFDDVNRDRELALQVQCGALSNREHISDLDRDWDDGWLHGIALAAQLMRRQRDRTSALRYGHAA